MNSSGIRPEQVNYVGIIRDGGLNPNSLIDNFKLTSTIETTNSSPSTATVYDATKDFSSSNPNGVWQYGWESTFGNFNSLSTYTTVNNNASLPAWSSLKDTAASLYKALVYKNNGSTTIYGDDVAPGRLVLHPGYLNEYATIRFTAPESANYKIYAKAFSNGVYAADPTVYETDVTILLNGQIIGSTVSTNSSPVVLDNVLKALNKNDTVDLLIGSKGSYYGDSTPIEFVVTPQITTVVTPQTAPTGSVTISGTMPLS